MFKLNIRVLLAVSVSLFVLYSLVSVVSAEPARSLRSTLEALTDHSKRQQGVVCQHYFCPDGETTNKCPDGCNNCQTILIVPDPYFEVTVCAP